MMSDMYGMLVCKMRLRAYSWRLSGLPFWDCFIAVVWLRYGIY
jgi:hypothetical protein